MNTTTLILETERKFPSHLLPISLCLCEPFVLGFGRVTVNNKSYFVACLNVTPATFEMIRLTVRKINWMGGGGETKKPAGSECGAAECLRESLDIHE